ncbi:MAG: hypothetical protein ABMA13_08330 [Chthoniobacteraceae bacterium]
MIFRILIILAPLVWLAWKTWNFVQSGGSLRERAVALRGAIAFWLIGIIVLIGFVFTPMPFKLLLVIPAFLVAGSVGKAFRDARNRLRAEESGRADLEKMKRINRVES